MAFEKDLDPQEMNVLPACSELRTKKMVTEATRDVWDDPFAGGNHHCWCHITQHVVGPDQELVERDRCVPGRDCYCE